MVELSLTTRRVISGLAFVQLLFFTYNYHVLHLLGPYDKKAMLASAAVAVICALFFIPTIEQMRAHQARTREE